MENACAKTNKRLSNQPRLCSKHWPLVYETRAIVSTTEKRPSYRAANAVVEGRRVTGVSDKLIGVKLVLGIRASSKIQTRTL